MRKSSFVTLFDTQNEAVLVKRAKLLRTSLLRNLQQTKRVKIPSAGLRAYHKVSPSTQLAWGAVVW